MPDTLDEALQMLGMLFHEEITVYDANGDVFRSNSYDAGFAQLPYVPEPTATGKVEIWIGAEFSGLTLDSLAEALVFFQGFICCLYYFASIESISVFKDKLSKYGRIDPYYRMRIMVNIWLGLSVEDETLERWFLEARQKDADTHE